MAVWDNLRSFIFGGAVARAGSDAVTPVLEPVRQHAWDKNRLRVLDPATVAELRAKGFLAADEAQGEVHRSGYNDNRLAALVHLAQTYPGLAELDRLSNRRLVDPAEIETALTRHGIPADWHRPLVELFSDLLSVADVAAAVQQGHLANHGGTPDSGPILPPVESEVPAVGGQVRAEPPDGGPPSKVPLTTIPLDPVDEAAGQGFDLDRLRVRANLAGLPPGAAELLTMWNRELIDEDSVDAGIREGHLKTKWAQAYKRLRWNVLGAAEYASAHLRGWIDTDAMYRGGKLTGHTKEQMDLLYLNRGRPLAPVQAYTAWARGAPHPVGPGYPDRPGTFDFEDFKRAVQQSDVRTEYVEPLWHNRFAYPTLFQLGRLASAGALSEARVRVILKYERYEQQDIDALVAFWTRDTGTSSSGLTAAEVATEYEGLGIDHQTALAELASIGVAAGEAERKLRLADDRRVKAARDGVLKKVHALYVVHELDRDTAAPRLDELGISPAGRDNLLAVWDQERAVTVKLLTPAQLKKAAKAGVIDQAAAVDALEARGYSAEDAAIYLGE